MLFNEPSPLETKVLSARFNVPYFAAEGYQTFLKASKMTPEQIAVTAKALAMHTVNFAEIEQNIVAHYDTFDIVAPAGSKCLFCGSEAKLLKQDQTLCVACADELEL